MADKKISALTAATTPLAGTEVLPIVQGGTTKKVSVANLTAGRDISALSQTVGTGASIADTRFTAGNNTGAPVAWGVVSLENCGGIAPPSNAGLSIGWNYSNGGGENNLVYGISAGGLPRLRVSSWNGSALVDSLELMANNDAKVSTGNLVIGTAGKGIDFSADGSAAGMTSELLDDYEEGTFTPSLTFGGGSTGMTYTRQQGEYTKIGNRVFFFLRITLSAKGSSTGNAYIEGLPFASSSSYGAIPVTLWWSNMGTTLLQSPWINASSTSITPQVMSGGVSYNTTETAYNNNSDITVSGSYQV